MTTELRDKFLDVALPRIDALFTFAFHLCGRSSDTEELVRDTVLLAYHSYSCSDRRMPRTNWFFALLYNTWLRNLRRVNAQHMATEFEEVESVCEAAHTEMEAAISMFDMDRLAQVIDDRLAASLKRLPVHLRAILLLSSLEGFSYAEIAQITGAPVGTVMSRLYRARRMLKQDLWQHAKALGFVKDRKHGL